MRKPPRLLSPCRPPATLAFPAPPDAALAPSAQRKQAKSFSRAVVLEIPTGADRENRLARRPAREPHA